MTHRKIKLGSIGTDVDLDAEEVYLADGRRLTGQVAEEIAERALARHRGRPSVTGEKARTPSLTVRVPPETRTALEELARAQGKRLAEVSREALDEYVSRHAS
jgi:predicted HicB family RNase H-like nuclease